MNFRTPTFINKTSLKRLAALTLLFAVPVVLAVEPGALRASYVYNLSKFVDWPAAAFGADTRNFTVCVQGDEIIGTLTANLQDKSVGTRAVKVVPLSRYPKGEGCQVLYLNKSELWRMGAVLSEIGNRPVLTVSDGGNFARTGGMIELIPDEGRLVFEINQSVVERVGLKISSKVLALAKAVHK